MRPSRAADRSPNCAASERLLPPPTGLPTASLRVLGDLTNVDFQGFVNEDVEHFRIRFLFNDI